MRVLVYTSPARGHLYPVVPIVQELRSRGHETLLYTLAAQAPTMLRLGLDTRAISHFVEQIELDDYRARTAPTRGLRSLATFIARAPHEASDLIKAIEEFNPDAILVDVNSWGAATAAEASGLPWAMYSPFLLMLPTRHAPPFGPGFKPWTGPLGRARDATVRRIGTTAVDRIVLPALNSLRVRHRLPTLAHFEDLFTTPPLLLVFTAEGFEYPRSDWPANVRLIGPINWSPPQPSPPWLAEMADPLVLVTCSTERQNDKRLLHVALEALPPIGFSVLGTTAAHDPAQFHAPPGSRVVRFLPHDAVLNRAVCVVCHGGMGITQKALAAGIPVVAVPFGRDQLETARRAEQAGAGVRLPPRHLSSRRLANAVITTHERRNGALRVSRAFAAAGGHTAAADALEALVEKRTPPPSARVEGST